MSATSALANSTATIFSLDVYKRIFHPDADDRRLVRMGRFASPVALAIAALVAPSVAHLGGVFKYFQNGVTYLATPFISVMLLGVLWKRTNYPGALFGLIGGSAITLALALGAPAIGIHLHWLYLAAIAQAITMAGIVAVSLLNPAGARPLATVPVDALGPQAIRRRRPAAVVPERPDVVGDLHRRLGVRVLAVLVSLIGSARPGCRTRC